MPIEINEMVVNAILDENTGTDSESDQNAHGYPDSEELKRQILSECRELFYKLMMREGDR
jgi:hypothetical protein